MKEPAKPADEARRLEVLRLYNVLDTLPEQSFDDLAALAGYICEAPISSISFVDVDRQWLKSRIGFPFAETPRSVSLCGHTILGDDLMIVPDATTDARFADNPLVTGDPHIRMYAGTPLITPDGLALGTLCVMDRVPRHLTVDQMNALRALGRQVMAQLELRLHARDLIESEERLIEVFRTCPAAVAINRWGDRAFVDVNAAFTQLFGWTLNEVVGKSTLELGLVDAATVALLRSRLGGRDSVRDLELAVRTRSGETRHVLIGSEPLELLGERHIISTFVDITARKHNELASSRLAAIVQSSDDAIIGKDIDGTITSWNRGAENIFGYSAAEMIGTSIMRLIPAERLAEESQILANVARGDGIMHLETVRRTKSGRIIDVSITMSPIRDATGKVVGVSKIARDITERHRAAEAQRVSEERYRTLFDYAPDGILIADDRSNYLDANPSVCQMLGYAREELIGMHGSDIVAVDEQPRIDDALKVIVGKDTHQREWQFRRKDGSSFAADVMATLMPDGKVLAMLRDSTERNRSEARLRRLIESNVQGVMMWGPDGTITGANDACLNIIGHTRADLEAGRIDRFALTPPEYAEADRIAREEIARRGVCTPYEKEYTRPDGSRVSILLGAASFADNADEGVCFLVDLTERKNLEKQFFRAQRMESIGTLAGGIAHDLNNVLAPILLSIAILKGETEDEAQWVLLDTVQGCAQRGAELVQQVLSFARGVEGSHVVVNPFHVIRELVKVLRETFPRSIDVHLEQPAGLWTINGDPTQIHQVFMNLSVNARDAMVNGGRLNVKLENVVLDETYAGMNIDAQPGAYVVITVADTGVGIPPEIRERVFEPFYTTKEVGKGTGLGLSTSLAIVKSHGGFVHLYSEVGHGTKFKVYLPANTTETAVTDTAIDQPQLPRGRGELVLVVDDEAAVRSIAQATLERFGYRVMLAANGAEAVALYAVHRGEVGVVLTDMAMPVMDGPATIIALKAIDPAAKIIGSSGLPSNDAVAKALGAGVLHFVPKPYTAETLLKTVRQALDDPMNSVRK